MPAHTRPIRTAGAMLALGGLLFTVSTAVQADAKPPTDKHDWCARNHPVHCPEPTAEEPTTEEPTTEEPTTEEPTTEEPTTEEPTSDPTETPTTEPTPGEVKAFPTAQGFGQDTPGGRGGRIIEVTNLDDSGEGSLRAALEASGPRIVVFRVAGTIEVADQIDIDDPYITIAGQTAPGDGVLLTASPAYDKGPLEIATHDVIVRHLRVRAGAPDAPSSMRDALVIDGAAANVVLDHVSVSWGTDGNIDVTDGATNVTIQWSIISEALNNANHPDGDHSRAMLLTGPNTRGISLHHNLFAHNKERNPQISTPAVVDMVNNVTYNYSFYGVRAKDDDGTNHFNAVNNLWKAGPDTGDAHEVRILEESGAGVEMHLSGNIGPHRDTGDPQWAIVNDGDEHVDDLTARHDAPAVTTTDATSAYDAVLAGAGATRPARDAVDVRVLDSVRDGTGGLIDSVDEVGGFPTLASGTPYPDADGDGMDDEWEDLVGLDPSNGADGNQVSPSGYTWVEVFLNRLAGDPA